MTAEIAKYDHKKEKLWLALGITEARFKEIMEKTGLIGFLAQSKSEAIEMIQNDTTLTEKEKPIAHYLMGVLLEQERK
jgi:hypothetical protein